MKDRRPVTPPARELVLWGFHPLYAPGVPVRIAGGTPRAVRREARSRAAQGWTCAPYPERVPPACGRSGRP